MVSALTGGRLQITAGGDVGFLASDNGASDTVPTLRTATATVDAFVEYYYTARSSLRVMYGRAAPEFESIPGRSLRRQHFNLNFIYNWELGRFRLFATVGGGAYFLSGRESGNLVGSAGVTKYARTASSTCIATFFHRASRA